MDKASIDDTLSCVDNMFLFLVYSVLTDKMDPLNWGPLALFSIRMGPRWASSPELGRREPPLSRIPLQASAGVLSEPAANVPRPLCTGLGGERPTARSHAP